MATKKLTARQVRRAARIKAGKCAACGKRKPKEGSVECGPCRKYFNEWARKAASAKAGKAKRTTKAKGKGKKVKATKAKAKKVKVPAEPVAAAA